MVAALGDRPPGVHAQAVRTIQRRNPKKAESISERRQIAGGTMLVVPNPTAGEPVGSSGLENASRISR